ncbi:SDR family NAD(P)-dependent oxidoreductase [Salirhabdus sp. Marseille-P4669]|uniref:SDR family NAD(P)-dependent oxidoreductase n=1 Tax=Salirhabdus sp. Marseille-P4669 TaxID=2042310 RepID=UPI000C7B0D69|nr:SDR family NAD(P)-dependent oxidoreductase [Salirhabdus sp. Marseille-P4669]
MDNLSEKVAVIIGGASGIGAATAQLFRNKGSKVLLVDINEGKGLAFQQELSRQNGEVKFIKATIDNNTELQKIINEAVRIFGRVDFIFHKATLRRVTSSKKHPIDIWRHMINVA